MNGNARAGIFLVRLRQIYPALAFACVAMALSAVNVQAQAGSADAKQVRRAIKQAQRLSRAELMPEAEKLLRETYEANKENSQIRTELAYVLTKRRKLREAYELVSVVCEAEPKNTRAIAVLGYVLLAAGRFPEARGVFFAALKLNRREDLAWWGNGMLEFYENNVNASLNNLQAAVYERPNEPDYLYALAQVNARAEKYAAAADAYDQFLSISSSTDSDRRSRIRGLISFLRYIGRRTDLYNSVGQRETVVNFDLEGNRPVITVAINKNEKPFRFVLDTGSGITVISEEAAKRLKLRSIARGGFAKGLGGDGRFEIVYGFLKNIDIGRASIASVPVYIRKFHDEQRTVDGCIGLAMISKFLTTIDYGNKTFALRRRDETGGVPDVASVSLPLRLTSSGFLSGEVQIEGIDPSLNFIVDTGASVSVISDLVAANSAVIPFLSTDKLRVIGSAGVTDDVPTFLLPKLTFGPHSQRQVQAIALDLDVINEATGFEQAGILGGNFLRNYRLTFDFKNSKVNFTPVVPALVR